MINFITAQMILARASVPDAQHPLIFLPHRGLRVKAMGTGVKMAVAAFNVDHKTHIAEITRFGGGIKSEEGDPAFIDTRRVFQVGP